jgi:hypothetical protein
MAYTDKERLGMNLVNPLIEVTPSPVFKYLSVKYRCSCISRMSRKLQILEASS